MGLELLPCRTAIPEIITARCIIPMLSCGDERSRSRKALSASSLPIAIGVAGHLSLAVTNDPHSVQPSAKANRSAAPSTRSPADTDQHRSSAIATGAGPQDASAIITAVVASNVRIQPASQSGATTASGRKRPFTKPVTPDLIGSDIHDKAT